jgi:CheY-like chemotaxis protein
MLEKLPACYFPTTTLLIDDNINFLQNMAFELGNELTHFELFSRPQDALVFFETAYQAPTFLKKCISYAEDDSIDRRSLEVSIAHIHQEIFNPNRFKQITTVVVDYAMPGLSGAAVAEQLQHLPVNIILLTGEAGHENALHLFNQGIIQHYIRKDAADASAQLNNAIKRLQLDYFTKLSSIIVDSIVRKSEQHDYPPPSCLNDPIFIRFFYNEIQKHNIKEFYLIEESGSFLCAKANGELSWLLIKHSADMDALNDELTFPENSIPDDIINKIKNNEVLRHAFNSETFLNNMHDWQQVLYPATKLDAKNCYYYSYVTEPLVKPEILAHEITSYNQFLIQK